MRCIKEIALVVVAVVLFTALESAAGSGPKSDEKVMIIGDSLPPDYTGRLKYRNGVYACDLSDSAVTEYFITKEDGRIQFAVLFDKPALIGDYLNQIAVDVQFPEINKKLRLCFRQNPPDLQVYVCDESQLLAAPPTTSRFSFTITGEGKLQAEAEGGKNKESVQFAVLQGTPLNDKSKMKAVKFAMTAKNAKTTTTLELVKGAVGTVDKTGGGSSKTAKSNLGIYLGVGASILGIIVAVVIVVVCCIKKRRNKEVKKDAEETDNESVANESSMSKPKRSAQKPNVDVKETPRAQGTPVQAKKKSKEPTILVSLNEKHPIDGDASIGVPAEKTKTLSKTQPSSVVKVKSAKSKTLPLDKTQEQPAPPSKMKDSRQKTLMLDRTQELDPPQARDKEPSRLKSMTCISGNFIKTPGVKNA